MEPDIWNLYLFALKSQQTRLKYQGRMLKFFEFIGIEGNTIQEKSLNFITTAKSEGSQWVFNCVLRFMSYQVDRVNNREIGGSTVQNYLKSVKLYFDIADIPTQWKKITRGLPRGKSFADDRIPSDEELQKLIEYPDRRIKAILFTMISSGIRLGAWDFLKWGDIRPIEKEGEGIVAAKILVYAGEDEEYYSYISKQAYFILKDWMDYRKNAGEPIDKNSWLMRDLWDTGKAQRGLVTKPKKLASSGIKRLIERAIWAQGLRKKTEYNRRRYPFSAVHSLRKWFKTRCEIGGMKPINVEKLLSHSIGISNSYYRPTETELLEDYLKVSNLLVIGREAKLERELKTSEQLVREKLQERDEQIRKIREEAQSKDDVLSKVLKKVESLENDLNKEKKWRNTFWACWGN